jgi:hypothetical protein
MREDAVRVVACTVVDDELAQGHAVRIVHMQTLAHIGTFLATGIRGDTQRAAETRDHQWPVSVGNENKQQNSHSCQSAVACDCACFH